MSVYKAGRRPDFMDRTDGVLAEAELIQTVSSFSFEGLQMAALLALVYSRKTGSSPSFIDEALAEIDASFSKNHFQE